MALARIKKGDSVKIMAGKNRGKIATVNAVLKTKNALLLSGIGERKRHHAANQVAAAGKRDVQLPVAISNVALVADSKTGKVSRLGSFVKPDGSKVRVAKALKNKEIK